MIRNLKALGLVVVTAFAISAVAAAAAQAETTTPHFTTFNTKTEKHESGTITGIQLNEQMFKVTATSKATLTCKKASFTGTTATGTETEPTVEPKYEECEAVLSGLKFKIDVRPNGCHARFHIGEEIEAGMKWQGTADVVCPAGKGPFIVELTNAEGKTKCTMTIEEQNGIGPIYYHNKTNVGEPTDIEVTAEATNIKSITEGGVLNCGTADGTHESGAYNGRGTVTAKNTAGEQIDLTVMQQSTP